MKTHSSRKISIKGFSEMLATDGSNSIDSPTEFECLVAPIVAHVNDEEPVPQTQPAEESTAELLVIQMFEASLDERWVHSS